MNSLDLVRMALGNLWRRKLRTFLTILGVIIGTTSIVVMLSLGLGMKDTNRRMIESMGDITQITVTPPGVWAGGGVMQENNGKKNVKLDKTALDKFKSIPSVVAVTPVIENQMVIYTGRYETYLNVQAIDPEVSEALGIKLADGRYLRKGDKNDVILGGGLSEQFHNPKARHNEPVKIDLMHDRFKVAFQGTFDEQGRMKPGKLYPVNVVGVSSDTSYRYGNAMYISLDTYKEWLKEKPKDAWETGQQRQQKNKNEYERVIVKVDNVKNVEAISEYLKGLGYNTYSLQDDAKEFEQSTNVVQAILGGIGGISLLVAAIGIANTMIMSIHERTREIGVMKVIGAAISDIKKLFLVEASFIGLGGGLLGSLFSMGISSLINFVASNALSAQMAESGISDGPPKISIVSFWLILAALFFSALIGLVSGYLPARRAMKLSALKAIRTE